MEKKYDFYKMNIRKGEYMRYAHLTHFFDEYDYNINRNISSIEGIHLFLYSFYKNHISFP